MDTPQNRALTLKDDDERRSRDEKFFITPGLHHKFAEFIAHYKIAPYEPILIVGATGVGKSLFLRISKILYREEYPDKNIHPIEESNCAHFGGAQSDPNVARAELFGSRKGTATGIEDKVGLIEKADNGLLILEEIGELPPEVQAMLLTFVETGEYRQLGGENNKRSNVKIIGATNREEALRLDFRYRFFPFYVPPLYLRRSDVLYYLQHNFPEIIETLAPWEVTALLAHNWPGNVREVQRLGWLLRRRKIMENDSDWEIKNTKDFLWGKKPDLKSSEDSFDDENLLFQLEPEVTSLNPHMVLDLFYFLKANKVDVALLEKILNQYGLGLSLDSSKKAFQDFPKEGLGYEGESKLKIPAIRFYEPFENAASELECELCHLFYQDMFANKNLLDIWNGPSEGWEWAMSEEMITSGLAKSCFEALSGITLSKEDRFPDSAIELEEFFKMLGKKYPDNEFLASLGHTPRLKKSGQTEEVKIEEMTKKQMLKAYYERLLKATGGNIAIAAQIAGLPRSTFWDDLSRVGVSLKDARPRFSTTPQE